MSEQARAMQEQLREVVIESLRRIGFKVDKKNWALVKFVYLASLFPESDIIVRILKNLAREEPAQLPSTIEESAQLPSEPTSKSAAPKVRCSRWQICSQCRHSNYRNAQLLRTSSVSELIIGVRNILPDPTAVGFTASSLFIFPYVATCLESINTVHFVGVLVRNTYVAGEIYRNSTSVKGGSFSSCFMHSKAR
ncbi:unnamed protein product, partial [Laminaria digitata]